VTGDEVAAALDAAGASVPRVVSGPCGAPAAGPASSWRDAFEARAVAVEGGHLHWCGATTGTSATPVVAFGGQVETAYRLAFRWWHGREPEGNVRPRCGYPHCVAGEHLADKRIREGGRT
jgi:hypothetical protein